jgi:hypothetical protein
MEKETDTLSLAGFKALYGSGNHNDRLNYAGHIRTWHPTAVFDLLADDPDEYDWAASDAFAVTQTTTDEDAVRILDAYLVEEGA